MKVGLLYLFHILRRCIDSKIVKMPCAWETEAWSSDSLGSRLSHTASVNCAKAEFPTGPHN